MATATQKSKYDAQAAVSLWVDPAQAERRHLKVDENGVAIPMISRAWLYQMKRHNDVAGVKHGEPGFRGPPYRVIGDRYFYPVILFDRYVLGDFWDDLITETMS